MSILLKILNYLGFCTAIIYTLVPIIFLYQLKSNILDLERISIIGIFCLYINGLIYFIIRALKPDEIDVRDFCNLVGAYLGFIYLVVYIKYLFYENEKNKFLFFLGLIIILSIIIFVIEFLTKDKDDIVKTIEWIGVIFNIFEYFPLGFNFIYIIKNKISEKFSLFGGISGLINTIVWLVWAIVYTIEEEKKIHSLIANIFGLILCCCQIYIYLIYRNEGENQIRTINTSQTFSNQETEVSDNIKSIEEDKEQKKPSGIIEEFI